jgi:hypothetical protein
MNNSEMFDNNRLAQNAIALSRVTPKNGVRFFHYGGPRPAITQQTNLSKCISKRLI